MKKIICLMLVCMAATAVYAQDVYNSSGRSSARRQDKKSGFNVDNLVLGGDVRLNIGPYLNVGISPMVGYKLANNFYAGVKLGYNFRREKYVFQNPYKGNAEDDFIFKQNVYSGSIWTRYILFQNFFLHVEAEANIYDLYDGSYELNSAGDVKYLKKQVTAPSVLVGAGIKQPISDRTSFVATVVYDVLQDNYSFYGKQLDIRFGVLVGF